MSCMERRSRRRRVGLLVALVLLATLATSANAQAQSAQYSLSGNMRTQIAHRPVPLPIPITFQPAPNGKVVLPADAIVFQTTGPDPKAMTFTLNTARPLWNAVRATAFVVLGGYQPLQQRTSISVNAPASGTAMFSAGGRTGPATLTWCPGQPLPAASFNPSCTNALNAIDVHGATLNASLRYQATANQFGGTNRAIVSGTRSIARRAGATLAPCKAVALGGTNNSCRAAFTKNTVQPEAILGAPFGASMKHGPLPLTKNVFDVAVRANGQVTAVAPTPLGSYPKDGFHFYGGPWTTGKMTVRVPLAVGGLSTWYLEGSDQRVDGIGSISLVSGGLGRRALWGYGAGRGWLNYHVGFLLVPSLSNGGLALLGAALLVTTAWMARRGLRPAR